MNKKNLESKEIRLGLIHVAGLLGLTVGCIAAAFCLGYLAGSKVGFERESSTILAELPKFPVNQEGSDDIGEKIANEVYAKLNEPSKVDVSPSPEAAPAEENMPELASIPDIKSDTLPTENIDAPTDSASDSGTADPGTLADTKPSESQGAETEQAAVKVLGDLQKKSEDAGSKGDQVAAVGSLLESENAKKAAEQKKVEAAPTVKADVASVKDSEKPKITGPVPVTNKVPPGWFAQVAAPKKPDDANLLAQNLRKSGFAVTIEAAEVRGEEYFRVLVGPEASKNQAQVLIQQLKRESYIKGEPFIRMVK